MKKMMSLAEKDLLAKRGVDFRSANVLSRERPMSRFNHFRSLQGSSVTLALLQSTILQKFFSFSFILTVVNTFTLFENLAKKLTFLWVGVEGYLTPVGSRDRRVPCHGDPFSPFTKMLLMVLFFYLPISINL
ncbi:hypothetical protein MHB40_23890 [Lysinibacillus sp. FSL K6-0057]|uniref:hypothetical protein n=1 Tax=unclassified Lysinibacillus TaxID=2636778 RepID=UPI0031586683